MAGQVAAADAGGYVGVAAGWSKSNIDAGEIDSSLASLGLGSTTTVDETDIGFKIYGGYQRYTNFGKFTSDTIITSGGSGTGEGQWKGYSIDLSALGILPVGDKLDYARLADQVLRGTAGQFAEP